jgi:uncharacterized protein YheU (UPF0270 family)
VFGNGKVRVIAMADASDEAGPKREDFVEIDPEELSPEARRGLIEEFVSREGTDYGRVERDFEEKCSDVARQLRTGEACVVFDKKREQVNLVLARDLLDD